MLGRQFSRELEQVHTVHDLAPHLERFLNAGYAVRREPNGGFVLLPDTIALEPFQSFVFELLADDHHGKYFGSRAKNLMRHLTYLIASRGGQAQVRRLDRVLAWDGSIEAH